MPKALVDLKDANSRSYLQIWYLKAGTIANQIGQQLKYLQFVSETLFPGQGADLSRQQPSKQYHVVTML